MNATERAIAACYERDDDIDRTGIRYYASPEDYVAIIEPIIRSDERGKSRRSAWAPVVALAIAAFITARKGNCGPAPWWTWVIPVVLFIGTWALIWRRARR